MKIKNKSTKMLIVALIMSMIGLGIGSGIGALFDIVNYIFLKTPLTWFFSSLFGVLLSVYCVIAVFIPSPIAVFFDRYMKWEKEYKEEQENAVKTEN